MATVKSYHGTPKVEGSHDDVLPGSPMAVLGVFVEVLRARYSQDNANRTPYIWRPDSTPTETEEGTEAEPRTLIIESQYLAHPDVRDMAPGLYVERGMLSFATVSIGNRGDHDQRSGADLYMIQATMPISIHCVSPLRGESMELGMDVGFYLLTLMTGLREIFGFQDVRPPVVDGTQVFRRSGADIESWITPVTTQVTCKYLWTERPIAPMLREIRMAMTARSKSDETAVTTVLTSDKDR